METPIWFSWFGEVGDTQRVPLPCTAHYLRDWGPWLKKTWCCLIDQPVSSVQTALELQKLYIHATGVFSKKDGLQPIIRCRNTCHHMSPCIVKPQILHPETLNLDPIYSTIAIITLVYFVKKYHNYWYFVAVSLLQLRQSAQSNLAQD